MRFTNKYLSEVAFFQEGPGVRKFQFRNEGVKLLNVGNINKGILDTSTTKLYISEEEAYGKYKHFLVDEGDLLIASSGIVVDNFHNKIAYVRKEHLPLCLNTSTIRFKSLDENYFNLDYLKFYLKTTHFKNQLRKLITGAAQLNFGPSHLKKITLPVPSLPDQIHIAILLSKAEKLIVQRKESIRLLDEYLRSTFLEMFGNNTSYSKNWNKISLVDGCINKKDVKCGPFGTQLGKSEYQENGIPVWGIPQINSEFKILPKEYVTESKALELEEYSVKPYDIVMSRKGNVGKCSLFPKGFRNGIIHSDVLRIRTDSNKLLPVFLLFQLKYSKYIEIQIKGVTKGAIMAGINVGLLKNILVHQPPIELQIQFTQIVEKKEVLKSQYQKSLQELENLYGSFSQKAFRGEMNLKEEALLMAIKSPTSYIKKSCIPDNKRGFAKQVLGGKIVSLFKDDNNFSHIKFQKLQYLAEQIAEENLLWNYYRQAAGPHDNKFKYNVIAKLNENKWFEERKYKFYPLQKANDVDRFYQSYFMNKSDRLNELFMLLKNATEKFCEAIATIYAVWNNHIILHLPYNKSDIKKDFFEWSNRKEIIFTEDEFEKAVEWMKKHNIEPKGFGQLIKERASK